MKIIPVLLTFLFALTSIDISSQIIDKDHLYGIWVSEKKSNDTIFYKKNRLSDDYVKMDSLAKKKFIKTLFIDYMQSNGWLLLYGIKNIEEVSSDSLDVLLSKSRSFDLFNQRIQKQELNDPTFISTISDSPCFQFLENEELKVSQNCGWCGTPPISYCQYTGKWSKQKNDIYDLSYPFWGGTIRETWKITSLSKEKMAIIRVNSNVIYDKKKR
ncbi:MAG: hypothetical protein P8I93_06885 [Crocinitomicaceae bacterium]|nr:hypothetical protein [Crocinitomicaceae bacterium]